MNDYLHGADKKQIRRLLLEKRNNLHETIRTGESLRVAAALRALAQYRAATTVMFYVTHGSEVMTEEMMAAAWQEGKNVAVPLVDLQHHALQAVQIASLKTDLEPGVFGVREPKASARLVLARERIDLVIVPGVAFDVSGHRIGYGKGFYDSWLAPFPHKQRVGIAFDFQIVERVPREPHDVPVGTIITEQRIIVIPETERETPQ